MTRRITASHEEYAEIYMNMTMLAVIKNSHVHEYKNTSINYTEDMHEFERLALIARIENAIEEWIEGNVVAEYVNLYMDM